MSPFSSLLTFGTSGRKSPLPPPTTHLIGTSTFPAPSNFLPLHYVRIFLNGAEGKGYFRDGKKVVIWIGCDGSSESHHRNALRKNGVTMSKEQSFVYIDALEEILEQQEASTSSQTSALERLHTRIEEHVSAAVRYTQADLEEFGDTQDREGEETARCLVVVDDASALAWAISALDVEELDDNRGGKEIDHRVQLLRSKRKGAIQKDPIGIGFGRWMTEQLRKTCDANMAILLTHLTVENSTITSPVPHTQATRGGSYGVGTGFDADDAGEEREDEELYEDVTETLLEETERGENGSRADEEKKASFSSESIDWRVDSLLRVLLLDADLWLEVRGLRSGKARDCHGEICIHSLFRPCIARQQPLPTLPMPSDPLRQLRSKDRTLRPLMNLNGLSISSASASSILPSKAWSMEIQCSGRENAMLFRVEPVGEAVAWSRGGRGMTSVG